MMLDYNEHQYILACNTAYLPLFTYHIALTGQKSARQTSTKTTDKPAIKVSSLLQGKTV
jgi:hypothetical protein